MIHTGVQILLALPSDAVLIFQLPHLCFQYYSNIEMLIKMDNRDTSSVFYYAFLGSSRHILLMSCGRFQLFCQLGPLAAEGTKAASHLLL